MNRRTEWRGLPVEIENEAGSFREWPGGRTLMRYPYGYFADHIGSDGDELDCYLGPDRAARFVYVVHQRKPDGSHDEDKCFLDFPSEAAAKAVFFAHRDDGELAYGGMSATPSRSSSASLPAALAAGRSDTRPA